MKIEIRLFKNNIINCVIDRAVIGLQSDSQLIYKTNKTVEDGCGNFLFTKDLINISEKFKNINDFNKRVVMLNVMIDSLLHKKLVLNIENRFVDNRDGAITDIATGLIWQKETASKKYKWKEAMEYVKSLTLAGHSNWRLPDINELCFLADKTKQNPVIDTTYFPNTQSHCYWSSSSYAPNTNVAWAINFYNGLVYLNSKVNNFYVRCVRTIKEQK